MHLHHHSLYWRRAALGFAAIASWLLATVLFASYTAAWQDAFTPRRFLLGASGWISGLIAIHLLARLLRWGR
jgi:hypothetical protein